MGQGRDRGDTERVKGERWERQVGGSVTGRRVREELRAVRRGSAAPRASSALLPCSERCPQPPRPAQRHGRLQALHPRAGGAAAPRPPGHEEARVRGRAVERLRRKSAAGREHRGCCAQKCSLSGFSWMKCHSNKCGQTMSIGSPWCFKESCFVAILSSKDKTPFWNTP